jgi:hypothetical protein
MDVIETLERKKAIETPCVADVEELLALLAAIIARLLSVESDRQERKAQTDRSA